MAIGILEIRAIQAAVAGLDTVYKDRVMPFVDLKRIGHLYAVNIVDTTHKVRDGNLTYAQGLANLEQAETQIRALWSAYKTSDRVEEAEKRLVSETEPRLAQANLAVAQLKTLLQAQDAMGVPDFTIHQLYPAIDPISGPVGELIELQTQLAKASSDAASAADAINRILTLAFLIVGVGVAIGFSICVVRAGSAAA